MTNSLENEFGHRKGRTDSSQDVGEFKAPDLTPEEYAEHTANQTANAFQSTKLFEVVEVKAGVGQVHLLGRVKQDDERDFLEKVITPVLKAIEASHECEGHICKQFILKNGKTKYAWTISFAANNLRAAAHAICEAVSTAVPRMEVMESPLVGPATPAGGGAGGGRKGAAPVR
jgi:hypothetical protein